MKKCIGLCGGLAFLWMVSLPSLAVARIAVSNDADPSVNGAPTTNGTNGGGIAGCINNKVEGEKLVNIAAGEGASAALASVVMENSSLTGRIENQAEICELMNIAGGLNSDANFATVRIANSVIDNTIVNRVSGSCAKNIALGDDSCANFASVVIKNHGVNGLASNGLPAEIINHVTVGGPGNDCNVAEAGQVSNKNSIVFK